MLVHHPTDRAAARCAHPRQCRRLAATLRRYVVEAHDPLAIVLSASPPLAREPIRASRALLTAIADRLADERPADARGLAMAHDLVTSPVSPLYPPSPGGALARAAAETLSALGEP